MTAPCDSEEKRAWLLAGASCLQSLRPTMMASSVLSHFSRLKPLDIAFMKAAHHKVNIVPVIAKADTLTKIEVQKLKRKVHLTFII